MRVSSRKKNRRKKRLLRVTGIFLAMSMLTVRCNASGGDDGEESASNEKVTLTIEASQEIMNNIPYAFSEDNIAAFEEEYPEIEVELVLNPDAQNTSILQTKLASGQPSDLICYNKVSAENELEIQKNCIDLSEEPFVDNLLDKDVLTAPDGKIYGFAFAIKTGGMGVVYNKTLFEEKGIEIPKTYDEFLDVCEISERIEKRGEEGGEKKGSEEKARTTAFNLFEMGMLPEQISRAVGEDISAVEGWLAGTE